MTDTHLCLTCKLADWKRTAAGRIHPNGQGKCAWTPPYIPTPAAWAWNATWSRKGRQPVPEWGQIDRRPRSTITECETYEVTP